MEPVIHKSSAPILIPSCYILTQGLVTAVTIYGTKARSLLRLPPLLIILWLAYLAFISGVDYDLNGSGSSVITAYSFLYTAHLVNILWISSVSLQDFTVAKIYAKGNMSRNSFLSVLHLVAFNFRGIRTPWKTKNIPPFPAYYPGRMPQSRIQFLARQIPIVMFQYLLVCFVYDQTSKISPKDMHRLVGPGLEYTYFSATREQWICRIFFAIGPWWFVNRCLLSGLFNLVSIVGVATGIFSVEDYPPFIGKAWSSYTLRGFWGKFWHQALRWPHVSLSTFITRDILHLPKPSLLERYSNIFVAFTISGILHVCIDIGNGRTEWAQTMLFFQSFAFGILIEDGIQALWRKYTGDAFESTDESVPTWKKIVGFIWVFSFFAIVAPWHIYPYARAATEANAMLPIGIMKSVGEKTAGTVLVVLGLVLILYFKAEI